MKKLLPIFIFFPILFACNYQSNKPIKAKAFIYERKLLNNGKLQVSYTYQYNKQTTIDSAIIDNKVLPADSVDIEISAKDHIGTLLAMANIKQQ